MAIASKALHLTRGMVVCCYCVSILRSTTHDISANKLDDSVNGLTCYTAGLSFVVVDFDLNPDNSKTYLPVSPIAGFSVYIFGIAFAPIVTPHIVERVGRSIVYLVCLPLCGVFLLGGECLYTTAPLEGRKC